jgi:uncharacterized protein (TIGR02117 family)
MKNIKYIFKKTLRLFLWVLAFVATYMLAAFLIPMISVGPDNDDKKADVTIYILTNGVHTDIVMPCKSEYFDWTKEVKFQDTKNRDSSSKYLAVGWGDKGFYLVTPTWADLKASTAFKAAFGLSTTALHTTYYKSMTISEDCKQIQISSQHYKQLIDYVNSSFAINHLNHPVLVESDVRYGTSDAFYEAKGSYSLFTTCNTWANNALKSCDQKACLWTPFDKGIFDLYE